MHVYTSMHIHKQLRITLETGTLFFTDFSILPLFILTEESTFYMLCSIAVNHGMTIIMVVNLKWIFAKAVVIFLYIYSIHI